MLLTVGFCFIVIPQFETGPGVIAFLPSQPTPCIVLASFLALCFSPSLLRRELGGPVVFIARTAQ